MGEQANDKTAGAGAATSASGAEESAGQADDKGAGSRSKAWEAAEQYKAENADLRKKLAVHESAQEKAKQADDEKRGEYEKLKAKYETENQTLKGQAQAAVVRAALLEEGQKLGLRSPAYLKLVDTSKLEVDGENVKGAAAAIKALKESDPTLFGAPDTKEHNTTVTTATPGGGNFDPAKDYSVDQVRKFTKDQRQAYLKAHGAMPNGGAVDYMTGRRT